MSELKLPLNNIQIELIKLYSTGLTDAEMDELKSLLSKFYAEKAIAKANEVWDSRGLTDADMDRWLNEKS